MVSVLVLLASMQDSSGLDTLRVDIEKAWTKNRPSYHRFLSEAFGLAQRAMEGKDLLDVYESLKTQGVQFEPVIDGQRYVRTEPMFVAMLGTAKHTVGLRWLTRTVSSPTAATRHVLVGAEVALSAEPKCPLRDFLARDPYPAGTVMAKVFSHPEFQKSIAANPFLDSVEISYSRTRPSRWEEVGPDDGFGCEFEALVYLSASLDEYATRHGSSFRVPSGLDHPTTTEGKLAPGSFEPKDTLGDVFAHIDSMGWTRTPSSSVVFKRIGREYESSRPTEVRKVYSQADFAALPESTEALDLTEYALQASDSTLLHRFKNLRWLMVGDRGSPFEDPSALSLAYIGRFPKLQELSVYGQTLDDQALRSIATLRELKSLRISSEKITDEGIQVLSGIKSLKTLWLSHCKDLTPGFTKHLAGLTSLESLSLWWCGTPSDESLADVCKLTHLRDLSLAGFSEVDPQGFVALTALKLLTELSVSHSSVDDRFLAKIPSTWPLIQSLSLDDDPNITDAGTILLGRLKNLDWLSLQGSEKLTSAGADRLAKALGPKYER